MLTAARFEDDSSCGVW